MKIKELKIGDILKSNFGGTEYRVYEISESPLFALATNDDIGNVIHVTQNILNSEYKLL